MASMMFAGTNQGADEVCQSSDEFDVVVVGLGFVGLTLALALCEQGQKVVGLDTNRKLIDGLKRGETHVREPGIEELLSGHIYGGSLFPYHAEHFKERPAKPITFILTVGTPIKNKEVDNASIIQALHQISDQLRDGDLLIIRSTVMVGTSRQIVKTFLRDINKDVFLAMCPERTIEGNALEEIRDLPQIIGGFDSQSVNAAREFFGLICRHVIEVSSLESAELLKLANNTYRDLMFAYSNEIANMAINLNISAREVISAANDNYPRSNIPKPGPSGGPCLEKDPWILYQSGLKIGLDMALSRTSREVNESLPFLFVEREIKRLINDGKPKNIGLLGLAFKAEPPVTDVRGSFALELVKRLDFDFLRFIGYEPAGTISQDLPKIEVLNELEEVLEESDIIVICTNHSFFNSFKNPNRRKSRNSKILILDMWGTVSQESLHEDYQLKSWG